MSFGDSGSSGVPSGTYHLVMCLVLKIDFKAGNSTIAVSKIGTAAGAFSPIIWPDDNPSTSLGLSQTITVQTQYEQHSLEELRVIDYNNGLKNADQEDVAETLRSTSKDVKKEETATGGPGIDRPAVDGPVIDVAATRQSRFRL